MSRGIVLHRVGGLSPVRQRNKSAPEKHCVWAFIWPYFDSFFIGSTGPEGPWDSAADRAKGREHSPRVREWLRDGTRKFTHHGRLWTRLDVPHCVEKNGWCLTDADTLAEFVRRVKHDDYKELRRRQRLPVGNFNPYGGGRFSVDGFEVFVPEPDEAPALARKR